MRRRSKPLSPEDSALWQAYVGGIQRIGPVSPPVQGRRSPAVPTPPSQPTTQTVPSRKSRKLPYVSGLVQSGGYDTGTAGAAAPNMDAKAYGRLKRGKLKPDARIDLHGMSAERAHAALSTFILDTHARGGRLVLVITGKGRGAEPQQVGVLRNAVPRWLALPPLHGIVLEIVSAHDRHGGRGAYYVYLRRRR